GIAEQDLDALLLEQIEEGALSRHQGQDGLPGLGIGAQAQGTDLVSYHARNGLRTGRYGLNQSLCERVARPFIVPGILFTIAKETSTLSLSNLSVPPNNRMRSRQFFAFLFPLIGAAQPSSAPAEAPAAKPVQMIIGFGPGGGYDLWGRTVAR